jgi:hypothetical protein
MKIIIELDDSIGIYEATEMVEVWEREPWARNVYIEQGCTKCSNWGKCDPVKQPD